MPRATARKGKPKNVRRAEKRNKSASDSGDAETIAAMRDRLRSSSEAPPTGSSAAASAAARDASSSPEERAHSERPPGTSSPIEVTDASLTFDATLPSALAADSHGEAEWDHAGDLAVGGISGPRGALPPAPAASRSHPPPAPGASSVSAPAPAPNPATAPISLTAAPDETPEERAARFGALAAQREREFLDQARLDKVTKAQRASEDAAYQKLVGR